VVKYDGESVYTGEITNKAFALSCGEFRRLVGISPDTLNEFAQAYEEESKKRGHPPLLSSRDVILLVLLYLRHYPVDLLLAFLFNVSEDTARYTRKRALDWLYATLKPRLTLMTPSFREEHGIYLFNHLYTFIVDGSEQRVRTSSNPIREEQFFSAKKGTHSINILCAITADAKRVLYLSPSFPGSVSDIEIVRKTRGEWLDLLSEGENGLADAGFQGLREEGIRIDTPPGGKRGTHYALFSSARIPVEQKLAAFKAWSALSLPMRVSPNNLEKALHLHHQHWTVVGVILNDFAGYSGCL
jgi:hypothetical protein